MSDTVTVAIISLIGGALIALIPAYFASRKSPSRRVSDTATIVDATGKAMGILGDLLDDYERQLDGARAEARANADENRRLWKRIDALEDFLRSKGIDPATVAPATIPPA